MKPERVYVVLVACVAHGDPVACGDSGRGIQKVPAVT
jgi:hypothetical protein